LNAIYTLQKFIITSLGKKLFSFISEYHSKFDKFLNFLYPVGNFAYIFDILAD